MNGILFDLDHAANLVQDLIDGREVNQADLRWLIDLLYFLKDNEHKSLMDKNTNPLNRFSHGTHH